jgi:hypothetical protein
MTLSLSFVTFFFALHKPVCGKIKAARETKFRQMWKHGANCDPERPWSSTYRLNDPNARRKA